MSRIVCPHPGCLRLRLDVPLEEGVFGPLRKLVEETVPGAGIEVNPLSGGLLIAFPPGDDAAPRLSARLAAFLSRLHPGDPRTHGVVRSDGPAAAPPNDPESSGRSRMRSDHPDSASDIPQAAPPSVLSGPVTGTSADRGLALGPAAAAAWKKGDLR